MRRLPVVTPILLLVPTFGAVTGTLDDEQPNEGEAADEPEDKLEVREHHLAVGDLELDYQTRVGTLVLREEDGTARAEIFYSAYFLAGADPSTRPLTICFNGGPGSSSVWLHLGTIGPRRVRMDEEGYAGRPPYGLVDNAETWLDFTDLVFVDPVSTGYSRAAEGRDTDEFHGVEQDLESVAEFIRLFVTRNGRWGSPKFLAGESYGTTRAAGLAARLQSSLGMDLNGLVLVSSILQFQTARFDPGNDLPYPLFLPTYAATAWYHGRLDEALSSDLASTLREVEEFALGPYQAALFEGSTLDPARRRAIAEQLARYTGLSVDYLERSHLRPRIHRFVKELLRDEGRTVGRLDSRYVGVDRDSAGERYESDPSYSAIQGPYTAALNDYVRRELGFESDLPYEILTGRVRPWAFDTAENRYLNVAERLRSAMARNAALHVFVASGYYDLATPYMATRYTFDHLDLNGSLQERVEIRHYEAGHMMYVHGPSRRALEADVAGFYARALE